MKRSLLILCFGLGFVMGGLVGWEVSRRVHSPKEATASATPSARAPAATMSAPVAAPIPAAVTMSAPMKDARGAYPILVASLNAGDVTEFKLADVIRWEDVTEEMVEGVHHWRVDLVYQAKTQFGPFDVTASAYVKDGKVVKWIYTGSGEVIP